MRNPAAVVVRGIDRRLGVSPLIAKLAVKAFPRHWSFLFGEVAVIAFVILVLTGIALTLFYEPSAAMVTYEGGSTLHQGREMPAAYASVVTLSHDVPGGLLLRRVHRLASHIFVAAILAHLIRVLATGAFRAPRELTHLIGVALLVMAAISGWTGHNLPFDVLAGTSLRILYALVIAIPWVGETLAQWLFAGEFPTGQMLPRMFALHALWAPLIITALLGLHLALIGHQDHTQRPRDDIDAERYVVGEPLWPWQAMTSTVLALGIGAVLAVAAALLPYADLDLHGPYRIGEATNASQPDWFLFWVEGLLRLAPPFEFAALGAVWSAPFLMGVALPLLLVAATALWPWIERAIRGHEDVSHVNQRLHDIPVRAAAVWAGGTFVAVATIAATNDVIARLLDAPIEIVVVVLRVLLIAIPVVAGVTAGLVARRRQQKLAAPEEAAAVEG